MTRDSVSTCGGTSSGPRFVHSIAAWTMNLSLVMAAIVLSANPAAAQNFPVPHPASAAVADSIRTVLDSSAAGWNRGDLAAYLSLYTEDVTSNGLNGFVHGKAAVADVMRSGFWKAGRPAQQLHFEHFRAEMLGSSYAVVTGEYVLHGAGRPDRTGWFTLIWRRTPQGWRCMHDHS